VTFNAVPASLGAIPDHAGTCQTSPFNAGRNVTFNVTGLDGAVNNVELSMTFGSPIHTWGGDITATLIAPNGSFRTIFGRTGATTATAAGDSSDLTGPYVFRDFPPSSPNGGWWENAAVIGATLPITAGNYWVTDSGGAGSPSPQFARSINDAFATVSNPNGTWTLNLRDGCTGDTGSISAASLALAVLPDRPQADFDNDNRSDLSVFRPGDGNWYVNKSTEGFSSVNWGLAGDIPAPGDFDGDGREDSVIFRPTTATWWMLLSSGGATATQWGANGDIPVAGDYDGDSRDDIAVFRPTTGRWFIIYSGGGLGLYLDFGQPADLPVPADYSGDGVTDLAVYRPSNASWWIRYSNNLSVRVVVFGNATDKPVPADYDGDNKTDIAIWRPTNGQWWIVSSATTSVSVVIFGTNGDIPVPGDYDGDEKDDQAIYRNGVWWLNRSTAGITAQAFGLAGDIPIPSKYIP